MSNAITNKLKIKAGDSLLVLNDPGNFKKELGELPEGVNILASGKNHTQIHWFVMNKAQMEREKDKVMKLMKADTIVWVYFPKGTSKIQTDLTRDKGWDGLLTHADKFTWMNLVSFNDTWSAFGFREKTAADKKKDDSKKPREIFNWVNPVTKEIRLPEELEIAFKKSKKAKAIFESLSFSNRKEYIEWIITAKQEATRMARITGTIDRLLQDWKNPSNR